MLFGGPGHDIIEGWGGDDKLYGGDGDDFIQGDANNGSKNQIRGGKGNDYITIFIDGSDNQSANDLFGDEGDDFIEGGRGPDDI